jgi:hypothetical protein
MLENKESFIGIEHFPKCLNSVHSLADFVVDAAKELNIRAKLLKSKCSGKTHRMTSETGGWTPKHQAMRPYGFVAKPDLTYVIAYHFSIRRMVSSPVSLLKDMTQIILTLSDIAPFEGTLVSLEAGGDTDLRFAAHLKM